MRLQGLTTDYEYMTFDEIFKRRIVIPQIVDMVLHLSATYDRENSKWKFVLINDRNSETHHFEISPPGTGIFREIHKMIFKHPNSNVL